jgi:hypothetical protein
MKVIQLGDWWPVMAAYGPALGQPPPADIGIEVTQVEYGEQLLGPRRWKKLVGENRLPDPMVKLRRDLAGTAEYEAAHPRRAK